MASFIPSLSRDNISLYTIPAAWAIAVIPRVYSVVTYQKATKKALNPKAPREWSSELEKDGALDAATKGRIMRAEAAQANGMENIGLFAASVVAGNAAGLTAATLNGLSLGYLASRLLYNYVYINNESKVLVASRTAVFMTGLGMCFTMIIQAGNRTKNAVIFG